MRAALEGDPLSLKRREVRRARLEPLELELEPEDSPACVPSGLRDGGSA
jgi:hypothetical protein